MTVTAPESCTRDLERWLKTGAAKIAPRHRRICLMKQAGILRGQDSRAQETQLLRWMPVPTSILPRSHGTNIECDAGIIPNLHRI